MKRYFLFTGEYFYPNGGMEDFDADFNSVEDAMSYVKTTHRAMHWHHVADMTTGEIVWTWASVV